MKNLRRKLRLLAPTHAAFWIVLGVGSVGAACGSDGPAPSAADTGSDAESDTTEQEDICWSETSVCTLECGEGSHCVVPGICAPLDDPGWRPEDYRDPGERDDLRSLLAEDGSFRGPVGLIDDMRFPQATLFVHLREQLYIFGMFPEIEWFGDHGPHTNYRFSEEFYDWISGERVQDTTGTFWAGPLNQDRFSHKNHAAI